MVRSPARALPVPAADIKSIMVRSPARALPVPAVHHVYCGEITSPGAPRPGRGYQVYYDHQPGRSPSRPYIASIAVRSPARALPVPAVHRVYCGEITSPGAPRPGRGYQVYYGEITSPGAPRPGRTVCLTIVFENGGNIFVSQLSSQEIKDQKESVWGAQVMFARDKNLNASYILLYGKMNAFAFKSDAEVYKVEIDLGGEDFQDTETQTLLRILALPERVGTLAYGIGHQPLSNLHSLILDGAEILTGGAVVLLNDDAILHVGQRLTVSDNLKPEEPLSVETISYSTRGIRTVYKQYFYGALRLAQSYGEANWIVDTCWYRATTDPRDELGQVTTDHLKKALLQGRRARVVADGFSSVTKAVYVLDNFVLFQSAPYSDPRDATGSPVGIGHQLTSTTKTSIQCGHLPTDSQYHAKPVPGMLDQVEWFVESRSSKELYRTRLSGLRVSGDVQALFTEIGNGQDIQVVMDILDAESEEPVTISVSADTTMFSNSS
ncbi:hypothetical protein RRG08_023418 [Elysia crispata]|uniref:Uncharacterized protein n=1 Tax=Elysia crispata TaxID=231223 RepID=A0AAE1CXT1_9GAST|nr:hypothetical protein RRG08_023418 [Elysia crispata]